MTISTRTRITMAALAATTAITTTAAVATGVAAHRADDRATAAISELDRERADRRADFEAMEVVLSDPGLRRAVWPDYDSERWVWDGVDGYDGNTTPHPVSGAPYLTEHRCPAGQVVSLEDVQRLDELASAAEWVAEDSRGVVLPRVIDVVGVRCVPAE